MAENMRSSYYDGNAVIDFSLFEPRGGYSERSAGAQARSSVITQPATKPVTLPGRKRKSGTRTKTKKRKSASFTDVVANTVLLAREKKARIKVWSVVALALVLMLFTITSYSLASELTSKIEHKSKDLVNLQQEYEAMRIEYETKMSDKAVEDYATSVLGMKRRESNQIQYVNMGAGDAFEMAPRRGIMSVFAEREAEMGD